MSSDIATLSIRIDSTDAVKADGVLKNLGNTAGWLEGMVKGAAVAFVLLKMSEYIKDATLLAARYETLGIIMGVVGNNAGYTRAEMEKYAKALQDSGISMVESRNTLATMAQAHIDLAKSQELARLAQHAATLGNVNSSEAFQRMIYGIQSGQIDVLKTIGINVSFEQGYAKLAGTLGKTTKDLSENEKMLSRTNTVLEKAPALAGVYEASMETAGKQLLSMKRYAEDLMTVLGALFGPTLRVGVGAVNDALKNMKRWLEENANSMALLGSSMGETLSQTVGLTKAILGLSSAVDDLPGLTFLRRIFQGISGIIAVITDDITALKVALLEFSSLAFSQFSQMAQEASKLANVVPSMMFGGKDSKQAAIAELGILKFYFDQSSAYAKEKSNEIANKQLASEKWYENLDQINKPKEWKDNITAPGGSAASSMSAKELAARRKALLEWQQFQAQSNQEYARTQREWDYADKQDALNEAYDQAVADQQRRKDLNDRAVAEEIAAYQDLAKVHTKLFGDMGNTLDDWSRRSSDAFVDFCFTGKNSFSDLINSMLKDLARLAMQKNTASLFEWIGGFISGGASNYSQTTSPTTVPTSYATGTDYVPRTGLALIHQGERIIPAAENRAGGGVTVGSIAISINTNGDSNVTTDSSKLTQFAGMMKNIAVQAIVEQSRPGGVLNPA